MRGITKDIARRLVSESYQHDMYPLHWGRVAYYEPGNGLYVEVNTEVLNLAPDDEEGMRWEQRKLIYLWPDRLIPAAERNLISHAKTGELVLVRITGKEIYKLEHVINRRVVYTMPSTQSRNRGAPVAYVAYEWSGEWVGVEPKRIACFVTHEQINNHEGLYPNERRIVHNALTTWQWQQEFYGLSATYDTTYGSVVAERQAWMKAFRTMSGFTLNSGLCDDTISLTYVTVDLLVSWEILLASGINPADAAAICALEEEMIMAVLEVAD